MGNWIRWAEDVMHLWFPRLCASCGRALYHGEKVLCTLCGYDLPYTDFHLVATNPAARQLWGRVPFVQVTALLYFRKGGGVQRLMHALKYEGYTEVGHFLGRQLGEKLLESPLYQPPDFIVPVPLHPRRQSQRGYNQCDFIAQGVSEILQAPLLKDFLVRTHFTHSQTLSGRDSRQSNTSQAFAIRAIAPNKGAHFLLIDDLMTTGATLEACATTLLSHTTGQISIATLAYTK